MMFCWTEFNRIVRERDTYSSCEEIACCRFQRRFPGGAFVEWFISVVVAAISFRILNPVSLQSAVCQSLFACGVKIPLL